MSFRNRTTLLVSLLLTVGLIVYAQETPTPPNPPNDLNSFSMFFGGGSFLGVYAEDIDKEKAGRYGLREARGVGITNIVAGSPAEKAGLRKDDVILRFDGENVTSVRKLDRLVSEVAPDQTVRLGISRGGSEQEVSVTIAERKNNYSNTVRGLLKGEHGDVWNLPRGSGQDSFVFAFGNVRRIGVSTMQLTKQLAEYFGVQDGVLVTAVTADSPAAKAGIRAGDVITSVDGEKVQGSGDLSRAINKKKEGDVTLTVIRNKSQLSITVTPKAAEPGARSGGVYTLPNIDVALPNINISGPRIVLPDIHVNLPRRIRVGSSRGPI